MIAHEILDKLISEYGLTHADMALLLKTTKSQIGMAVRGLRDLPSHAELHLIELDEKFKKSGTTKKQIPPVVPPALDPDRFRAICLQRIDDIFTLQWKLEKKIMKMVRVTEKSAKSADACHQLLAVVPEGDLHGHFKWKLRNQKQGLTINNAGSQLELKMKKDILAAELEIIKRYLAELEEPAAPADRPL